MLAGRGGDGWAMTEFEQGDKVTWKSHGGEAVGHVERKITSETTAAGRKVKASDDEPQYLVSMKVGVVSTVLRGFWGASPGLGA